MSECANEELHKKFNEKIKEWFSAQESYKDIFSKESENSLNQLIKFAGKENMTAEEKSAFEEWCKQVKTQSFREAFETCFNDYNKLIEEKENKNMTCSYRTEMYSILKRYKVYLGLFVSALKCYEGINSYEKIFNIDKNMFSSLSIDNNKDWLDEKTEEFCNNVFNLSEQFRIKYSKGIEEVTKSWHEFIKEINKEEFFFNPSKKLGTLFKEKFSAVLEKESPLKHWAEYVIKHLEEYDVGLNPNLAEFIKAMVQFGYHDEVKRYIEYCFEDDSESIFNLSSIAEEDYKDCYGYALNLGLEEDNLTINPQSIIKKCEELIEKELKEFLTVNGSNSSEQLLKKFSEEMGKVFENYSDEVKELDDAFENPEQLRNIYKEQLVKTSSKFDRPFFKTKLDIVKRKWLGHIDEFVKHIKRFRDENDIDKLIKKKNKLIQDWNEDLASIKLSCGNDWMEDTFSDEWMEKQFEYYKQSHPEKIEEPYQEAFEEEPESEDNSDDPTKEPEEQPEPLQQPEENSETSNSSEEPNSESDEELYEKLSEDAKKVLEFKKSYKKYEEEPEPEINKELHKKFNEKIKGWFSTQESYKDMFSKKSENSLNQLINFAEQENMTAEEKSAFEEWCKQVKTQSFREAFETCFNDYNKLIEEKENKNMTCSYRTEMYSILKRYKVYLGLFVSALKCYEGINSYEKIFNIDKNMFSSLSIDNNKDWLDEKTEEFCNNVFNLSEQFRIKYSKGIEEVTKSWHEFIKEINKEEFFFNPSKKLGTLFKEKFSAVLEKESPLKHWAEYVIKHLEEYDVGLNPNLAEFIKAMVQFGYHDEVKRYIEYCFEDDSESIFNLSSIAEEDYKDCYGYALNLGLEEDNLTINPQSIIKKCEELIEKELKEFLTVNGSNSSEQLLKKFSEEMGKVFENYSDEVKELDDAFENPEQLRNIYKEQLVKTSSKFDRPFFKTKLDIVKRKWLGHIDEFVKHIKRFRDENDIDKLIKKKNKLIQDWNEDLASIKLSCGNDWMEDTFSDEWMEKQFEYYKQSHPEKIEEPYQEAFEEEPESEDNSDDPTKEPEEQPEPLQQPEEPKPEIQSEEQPGELKPEENSENSDIEQQQSNSGTTSTFQQPKEPENPSKPNLQPEPSSTKPLETDHTQQPKDEIEPTTKPNSFHQLGDEIEAVPTESNAHQQNIEHEEQPEPQQQQEGNVSEIDLFNKFQNLFNDGGVCFIRPNINGLKKGREPSEASVALAFMHVFNPIFSDNKQKKTRKALEDIKNKFIDHDKKFRPKYVALIKKREEAKNKGDLNDDRKREKIQKEAKKLFENAQKNLDKITKKLHSTLSLKDQYTSLKSVVDGKLYNDLRISDSPVTEPAEISLNTTINDSEFKGCIDRFFKIFGIRGNTSSAKDIKERYYRIGVISYKPINNYNRNRRLDYVFTEIFDKYFDEKSSDSQTRRWCQRFQKELGKYSSNYFTKFINLEKTIADDVTVLNNTSSGNGKKIVDLFKKARKDLLKIFEGMYQNSKNLLYYRSLVRKNKDYFKTKMDIFKKLKKETDGDPEKLINELKKGKTAVYKYSGK